MLRFWSGRRDAALSTASSPGLLRPGGDCAAAGCVMVAFGGLIGTRGEVLTTRGLPSEAWLMTVSSIRKNFSASIVASDVPSTSLITYTTKSIPSICDPGLSRLVNRAADWCVG
jgi:hypothetical protein